MNKEIERFLSKYYNKVIFSTYKPYKMTYGIPSWIIIMDINNNYKVVAEEISGSIRYLINDIWYSENDALKFVNMKAFV